MMYCCYNYRTWCHTRHRKWVYLVYCDVISCNLADSLLNNVVRTDSALSSFHIHVLFQLGVMENIRLVCWMCAYLLCLFIVCPKCLVCWVNYISMTDIASVVGGFERLRLRSGARLMQTKQKKRARRRKFMCGRMAKRNLRFSRKLEELKKNTEKEMDSLKFKLEVSVIEVGVVTLCGDFIIFWLFCGIIFQSSQKENENLSAQLAGLKYFIQLDCFHIVEIITYRNKC